MAHLHPDLCLGIYTVNPIVPPPKLFRHPLAYAKQCLARWSGARLSWLSFGYVPSDFTSRTLCETSSEMTATGSENLETLKYGLADSPTCLLAFMLGLVRPYQPAQEDGAKLQSNSESGPVFAHQWSASDVLTWTMVYWLSGTEAPLRWLRQAQSETAQGSRHWTVRSKVPLGISHFGAIHAPGLGRRLCPPIWTTAYHNLTWLRRHHDGPAVRYPAWEASDQVVVDLRSFVQELSGDRLSG